MFMKLSKWDAHCKRENKLESDHVFVAEYSELGGLAAYLSYSLQEVPKNVLLFRGHK